MQDFYKRELDSYLQSRANESKLEKTQMDNDTKNNAGMTVKSPLILEKVWVKPGKSTFKYTTKKVPIKAGIDPYNKMIDRIPNDNVMTVEKP